MWKAVFFACLAGLVAGLVTHGSQADPADLRDGVLIIHSQPTYELTNFCELYPQHYSISSCEEQVNRLNIYDPMLAVTFVLAAWNEEKEWCEAEFGLGSFDPIFAWIVDGDPCFPSLGTAASTAGWPGPNEGVILTATDVPWSGTFKPLYWLTTYIYAYHNEQDLVPLDLHPVTSFAGYRNCAAPPEAFAAECLGGLGINRDGIYCCPPDPARVIVDREGRDNGGIEPQLVVASSRDGRAAVHYTLTASGHARLDVFDGSGRLVISLVDGYREAGEYQAHWNGRDLSGSRMPSGVYHVQLEALGFTKVANLLVVR